MYGRVHWLSARRALCDQRVALQRSCRGLASEDRGGGVCLRIAALAGGGSVLAGGRGPAARLVWTNPGSPDPGCRPVPPVPAEAALPTCSSLGRPRSPPGRLERPGGRRGGRVCEPD